ncbi:hypothetical protein [Nocardiopsis rhodophaea]
MLLATDLPEQTGSMAQLAAQYLTGFTCARPWADVDQHGRRGREEITTRSGKVAAEVMTEVVAKLDECCGADLRVAGSAACTGIGFALPDTVAQYVMRLVPSVVLVVRGAHG